MTRHAFDETEYSRVRRQSEEIGFGPLFDTAAQDEEAKQLSARQETLKGIARAEASLFSRGATGSQMVRLARQLAIECQEITVADLRVEAVKAGLLTGHETGRELSWLGSVMQAAGLVNTGRYVRSHVVGSHGNPHIVWAAPQGDRL
jgi:hypothetical protein